MSPAGLGVPWVVDEATGTCASQIGGAEGQVSRIGPREVFTWSVTS